MSNKYIYWSDVQAHCYKFCGKSLECKKFCPLVAVLYDMQLENGGNSIIGSVSTKIVVEREIKRTRGQN